MRPSAGTPSAPSAPGAPASPAAPGAAFRPGAPVSPDAPRGGDTSEAAPGALFRPGAPVPPSAPRTGGPAFPPPGPASGEGADASRTAGEGFSPRFESGVPGGEDERSHAEGTPPLRASRIGEERDEAAVLSTTPQERRDESEDGAESGRGAPGTGQVEDEAGQRPLTAGEGGRTGDASRADEAPRAGAEGADGADGARSDSRGVLASQGEDGPAETDDGGGTRRDAENAEAEAGDAEIGDAAPQAGDDASRTGGEAGHDAGPAGIDDEAESGGEVHRDAGPVGATGRRATSEADPTDPTEPAAPEPAAPAGSSESADETRHERGIEIDEAAGDEVRDETGTAAGGTEAGNERIRGEDDETRDEGDETPDGKDAGAPDGRTRETPLPEAVSEALSSALTAVRTGVTDLSFGLDLPGADEARRVRSEILAQLDDYVIPRVHTSTAPALVVVAGSTGAGKSTLLNTLANAKVSATGVRRPTTGTPVLACHPDDHEWFAEGDLLGSLRRLGEPDPEGASGGLVLVSTERLPPGVALLDTPDIDSVVEEHHEIAHRMLDAADLWIFVTTAARYADAPAWRLLRLAKERGARLAIVLSRVPPRSQEVISKHFVRMLTEYGLGEVDRFVINESKVTDGMLPDHEVSELRLWLTELSVDDRRRAQAVQATLDGVLNSFRTRVPALAKQLEIQVAFRRDLRGDVDGAYARALAEIDKSTGDGSLLRGEVLARWQDFAGSGDLMRTLHLRRPSRFGGKASQQAPERLSGLKSALRAGLESVVVSAAHRAAEETSSRWLNRPGAQEALASVPGLGRASDELLRRTGRTIAAWQEHIIELIRTEGVTKRSVARVISFDVESLSLILTIGLLGYGSSDAQNGTGALPQRLVHALLGAESLRNIGVKARSDLRARIGMLFDDEMARYTQALDGAGIPDESAATRLYQATYNLEVAR
ncbi:GTPase [Streptosporangium sp. NPDC023963]|uniref:GTPase n=1 Tax=Streptosporangium sp. NPDC023963 TaxID=3155608 RepID=UPI003430F9C1